MKLSATEMRADPVALAAVSALALTVAGCDSSYGVNRTARLDSLPSLTCVHRAIETSPGVAFVQQNSSEDVYTFTYGGTEGSHIRGALQLIMRNSRDVSFSQSLMMLGIYPPQQDIDATRPVMQRIEEALASKCGIAQLPAQIKEQCSGVTCPPLTK
jgi:hypothetical protein